MPFTVWFSLFLVCLLGAMSPGPSLAMVTKHSLAGGRVNGLATAWSHACVIAVYALLSVTGLTLVLARAEWLFRSISLMGAVYLIYLGWKSLRSSGGIAARLQQGDRVSVRQSAKEGAMIALLNPKASLFFMALFSQFLSAGYSTAGQALLVLTPFLVDGCWYTLMTLLLSSEVMTRKIRAKAVLIDRLSGVVLIGLAAKVIVLL